MYMLKNFGTYIHRELMMQAAKKYGVVTQMGNQGHSEANYFQFKAWKEAGIIKDVTAITAHMNSARRWHGWDVNMKVFLVQRRFLPPLIGTVGKEHALNALTITTSLTGNGAVGMNMAWEL